MSFFALLSLVYTFIATIVWSFLLWLITRILRWKWMKLFSQIWVDLMFIWFLTTIVLITNPLQNSWWIMLSIAVIYFFMYYFANKASLWVLIIFWKKEIKSLSSLVWINLIFILFLAFLIVFGKGQSMKQHLWGFVYQDGIYLWSWSVWYDSSNYGYNNMLIHDSDSDWIFDTIYYDINKDNFADQIIVDTNNDGIIDNTKILSYDSQKRLVFIITLIFAFVSTSMFQLRANETKKQINEIALQIKELDKTLAKPDKKKKVTQKKKVIKRVAKTAALIIALTTIIWNKTIAQPISWILDISPSDTTCISQPFDDIACKNVDSDTRLIYQHLLNPIFQLEIQSWEKRFERCRDTAWLCNQEPYIGYVDEFNLRWQSWTWKTPSKDIKNSSWTIATSTNKLVWSLNTLQEIFNEVKSWDEIDSMIWEILEITRLADLPREIVKSEKAWTDINTTVLQSINALDLQYYKSNKYELWQSDINSVRKVIQDIQWFENWMWLKTDDIVYNIIGSWSRLWNQSTLSFENWLTKNSIDGKLVRTIFALSNYSRSTEISWKSSQLIMINHFIWYNPYDMAIKLITWSLRNSWLDAEAALIDNASIAKLFTCKDGIVCYLDDAGSRINAWFDTINSLLMKIYTGNI